MIIKNSYSILLSINTIISIITVQGDAWFMHDYYMNILRNIKMRINNHSSIERTEYHKSRNFFIVDGITSSSIALFISGSILAGYLKMLGVSDSMNGIISALPVLLMMLQPIGAILSERLETRKKFVCTLALTHRLIFACMFFVPLLFQNVTVRIILIFIFFFLGHSIGMLMAPATNNWIISLVPRKIRGQYFSTREKYLIVISSLILLIAGYIIDTFKERNNAITAYYIISFIVFVLAFINFFALSKAAEPKNTITETGIKLRDVFLLPLKSKQFMPIVIFNIMWHVSSQIVIPYLGVFWVSDLKLSYTYLMVVAMVMSVFRTIILKPWGKFADNGSWANVVKIAVGFLGITHILFSLLVPSNAVWLFFVLSIFSNISWAVIGISILNIQFDYAPENGRTLYIGANAAIGGIAGFGAAYIGSLIMIMVSNADLEFMGAPLKGQQVLLVLSGLLMLFCATYVHKVVAKRERNEQ